MPRISAPTVAEHRAAQLASLLESADALVREQGVGAVNPTSVGERAGIPRSTVYTYFSSRDEILVALSVDAFEKWARGVDAALAGVTGGGARLARYVEATVALAADDSHALAAALRTEDLSAQTAEQIVALHDTLLAPLVRVLIDAGVADVPAAVPFVQALLGVGVSAAQSGDDPGVIAARINGLLATGLPRAAGAE